MQKTVFKGNEFKRDDKKVMLQLCKNFAEDEEKLDEVEEVAFEGPTADDLRREAEEFKKQWEIEKKTLLDDTEAQAEQIIKNAENAAFAEVKQKTDEAAVIKQNAQLEAEKIINDAKAEAERIIAEAQAKSHDDFEQAKERGFEEGRKQGYDDGNKEAQRLVDMLHQMIDKIISRRQEIFDEAEQQIVEMVILVSRKVVKIISEKQREVVMNNIVQALRKVKGRASVTIRVNNSEAKLTTEHAQDFMNAVSNIEHITVVEDSSIEPGGCIVETDFGSIDARISSQLSELEQKILEISPIKSKPKTTEL